MENVVLVFKKGKKDDSGLYRPVSLPAVAGKIMEKIILEVTEKNLKASADKVFHPADQGKPGDEIFFDLGKAFDTVSPNILLDKMSSTQLDKHIM
ncbi:hypothetical protein BTVI_06190 [Pitangus sulphuratus]|nr:hypothetical protein BTVI_06190 [Pitangus sulphuratus]